MLIIVPEIMKIIDERKTQKIYICKNQKTNQKTKTEKNKGVIQATVKGWQVNDFAVQYSSRI